MAEERRIAISALQHYVYCPRQCALIHVEQTYTENIYTVEGNDVHEHADEMTRGERSDIPYETRVPLWSDEEGLIGIADMVEFRSAGPYPVEYKRGSAKAPRADEVQLCAQALCLEEMLDADVMAGAIYRHTTRSRTEVQISPALREYTHDIIERVREMLRKMIVPPPPADARCDKCSLREVCMSEALASFSSGRRLQLHHRDLYHPQEDIQ